MHGQRPFKRRNGRCSAVLFQFEAIQRGGRGEREGGGPIQFGRSRALKLGGRDQARVFPPLGRAGCTHEHKCSVSAATTCILLFSVGQLLCIVIIRNMTTIRVIVLRKSKNLYPVSNILYVRRMCAENPSTRPFFLQGRPRPEVLLRGERGGTERKPPVPSFPPQTTTGCAFDPDLPRAKPEMSKAINGGGDNGGDAGGATGGERGGGGRGRQHIQVNVFHSSLVASVSSPRARLLSPPKK